MADDADLAAPEPPPAGPPPPPPPPPPAPPRPPVATSPAARRRSWPRRIVSLSTWLAWLSLACFVAGAVLWLLPVHNQIQSCGVPAAFLATGRQTVHAAAAPAGHPGFTQAQADHINRNLCSTLVADRAVPAAALLAGTLVIGLIAFVLAAVGHRAEWRDFAQLTGKPLPTWRQATGGT